MSFTPILDGVEARFSIDPTLRTCRFCVASSPAQSWDVPLCETQDYRVLPSLGSLVPGWTLIVPKKHVLNLSAHYLDVEFQSLRRWIAKCLEQEFPGTPRYFEHGASRVGSPMGCGVDHAHGHLVPLDTTVAAVFLALEGMNWQRVRASHVDTIASDQEYLFYSDDALAQDPWGWLATVEDPTSQFFRRIIADQLGVPERYDYRNNPFEENIRKTREQLGARLATKESGSA